MVMQGTSHVQTGISMRVVQFGAGRIGKIHAGNIAAHPRSELVGIVDPVADAETIETELMLADLESIEKRRAGLVRKHPCK